MSCERGRHGRPADRRSVVGGPALVPSAPVARTSRRTERAPRHVDRRAGRGHRRRWVAVAAGTAIALLAWTGAATAEGRDVEEALAQGVTLSGAASCGVGALDVTYEAGGEPRQIASFTATDGSVLARSTSDARRPDDDWVEHVVVAADEPPVAGTLVALHVTIGSDPPDADTAEFVVVYQCDRRSTDEGGLNTVLATCSGAYGTCPRDAQAAVAGDGTLQPATAPPDAVPLPAQPTFTG